MHDFSVRLHNLQIRLIKQLKTLDDDKFKIIYNYFIVESSSLNLKLLKSYLILSMMKDILNEFVILYINNGWLKILNRKILIDNFVVDKNKIKMLSCIKLSIEYKFCLRL